MELYKIIKKDFSENLMQWQKIMEERGLYFSYLKQL
jgi:hypothetical protein